MNRRLRGFGGLLGLAQPQLELLAHLVEVFLAHDAARAVHVLVDRRVRPLAVAPDAGPRGVVFLSDDDACVISKRARNTDVPCIVQMQEFLAEDSDGGGGRQHGWGWEARHDNAGG